MVIHVLKKKNTNFKTETWFDFEFHDNSHILDATHNKI